MTAIFIDRDGVINKDPAGWTEHSYVTRWSEFHFLPGSLEALKLLRDNGIKVIVISNQAGVNKGYFTKENLDEITSRMAHEVDKRGGRIDEVYYCVHKSEDNCDCRKPKTGMLERAAKKHRIYFDETYFIGDSEVDVAAGRKLGCKTIFVLSGKTGREESEKWSEKPDYIFNDLLESVRWILARRRRKSDRALRRKMFKSKRQGDIGPVSKGED